MCGGPAAATACRRARTDFLPPRFVRVAPGDTRGGGGASRNGCAQARPSADGEYALDRQGGMRERYMEYLPSITGAAFGSVCSHGRVL